MAEQLPRYEPGEAILSASALNRQAEIAEQAVGGVGAVGTTGVRTSGGAMVTPHLDQELWIQLLTLPTGVCFGPSGWVYGYNWQEVTWDAATCSWVTMSGGRSGSAFDVPAIEANNSATLAVLPLATIQATVIKAEFAPDGLSVLFEYGC